MKVKALCTIKDGSGWHKAGEVFETEEDLGSIVEVLDEKKAKPKAEEKPEVKEPEVKAPEAEEPKPKTTRKRKLTETE